VMEKIFTDKSGGVADHGGDCGSPTQTRRRESPWVYPKATGRRQSPWVYPKAPGTPSGDEITSVSVVFGRSAKNRTVGPRAKEEGGDFAPLPRTRNITAGRVYLSLWTQHLGGLVPPLGYDWDFVPLPNTGRIPF
jgi:hypothetical protein